MHDPHSVLEEHSECNVCDTSKHLKLYQHNNAPVVVFNEHVAVETRRCTKKVIVTLKFDSADQSPSGSTINFKDNGES